MCLKTLVQLELWEQGGVWQEMISYMSISAGLESPVPPSGGEGVTGPFPKLALGQELFPCCLRPLT